MAVVSTTQQYVLGEEVSRRITVRKGGMFHCKLPESLVVATGCPAEISADTLKKVEAEWMRLADNAKANTTTDEKVIVYSVQLHLPDGIRHTDGYIDDISFAEGLALSLSAGVYTRTATHKPCGDLLHSHYMRCASQIPEVSGSYQLRGFDTPEDRELHHCIPWTAERELFFARAVNSLLDTMHRLASFRTDKEHLLAVIDNEQGLLT